MESESGMTGYAWRRIRHIVIHKVLHADDTPHRIATGVGVGLFVACSPLMGLHMLLALVGTMLLRGNRAVSVMAAWVSNPITFAPIMAFNWIVGHAVLPRSEVATGHEVRILIRQMIGKAEGLVPMIRHVFTEEFWSAVMGLVGKLGAELWIGSVLVGLLAGLFGYLLTYRGVIWRRAHRGKRHRLNGPAGESDGTGPSKKVWQREGSPRSPSGVDAS